MATPKQIRYTLSLLHEAGYSTKWMNKTYKDFGASMRERSGRVEDWLRAMSAAECSELIDRLQSSKPYRASRDPEVKRLLSDAGADAEISELRKIAGLDG